MRLLTTLLLLFTSSCFVVNFQIVFAKPLGPASRHHKPSDTIAIRSPNPQHSSPLPVHQLFKRAPPNRLPGGSYISFDAHYQSFTSVPNAARALEFFYSQIIEAIDDSRNANFRNPFLCITEGPFQLVIRAHEWNPDVPVRLIVVRELAIMMLRRAQRGLAIQFSGTVHERDGTVFEMLLRLAVPAVVEPVVRGIVDSAMDMFGDGD
ncbi:MAG: hypothetical protein Q9219_005541 [cf. Caloplaca sp. 3 TL-2023]